MAQFLKVALGRGGDVASDGISSSNVLKYCNAPFCCLAWSLSLVPIALTVSGATTFQGDPEYLIDTWETEDGLPENSATSMAQTADGYLWFGTFKGLVRFDGVKFAVFTPQNTPQLPSAGIVNLYADRQDRLWVSTDNGVGLREGAGWRVFGKDQGWPAGDFVRTFTERQNGDLLITTFNGEILEFSADHLRQMPSPTGGRNGFFGYADEAGRWNVAKKEFIGRWDGQHWVRTASSTDLQNLPPEHVCAGVARDSGWWLLTNTQLRKYHGDSEVLRLELPVSMGNFWSLSEDSRGNLWICSMTEGLFRISHDGQTRHWDKGNGLPANGTRFAFEDREQNIWVGTSGNGLMRFKPRRFRSYGFESGLSERVVKSLAAHPDGSVWIGTWGSDLFRLSETGLTEESLPNKLGKKFYVQSVLVDRLARIWVGTLDNGLWISEGRSFRRISDGHGAGLNPYVLFQDSRGRIWAGDSQRVAVFGAGTNRYYGAGQGLPPGGFRYFAEDSKGQLWFANPSGLFNLTNEHFVEVKDQEKHSIGDVSCIKAEGDGALWLGTLSSGLLRWKQGRLTRINAERGLPVAGVYELLEDESHFFWMTSSRGIVRAARKELEWAADGGGMMSSCQLLNLSDGLPSAECANGQQPTCARDIRGRLWFATLKGIATTDPKHFVLNTNPPLVQVECVAYHTRADRSGDKGRPHFEEIEHRIEAPFTQPIEFPAGSRHIQVQYTGLSFRSPEKVRFQVRLEPLDNEWYPAGKQREARFVDLPPGQYTFRVRAANDDSLWNVRGVTLAFSVKPFLWQMMWFRGGVGMLLIVAGGGAVWWRSRKKHRREVRELEKQQQDQAELSHLARVSSMGELAASVTHELTQPLAAILSNAEAAKGFLERNPPELNHVRDIIRDIVADDWRAAQIIRRLRHLFRQGKIQPERLDFNDLVLDTLKMAKPELAKSQVIVRPGLDADLPTILADRVQLQQVLLNLITNACHAMRGVPVSARKLVIATRRITNSICVTVSDRGSGIAEEDLPRIFEPFFTKRPDGLGIGLSVCRTIIEAHKGKLWAENNAIHGADFHFTLPVEEKNDRAATGAELGRPMGSDDQRVEKKWRF